MIYHKRPYVDYKLIVAKILICLQLIETSNKYWRTIQLVSRFFGVGLCFENVVIQHFVHICMCGPRTKLKYHYQEIVFLMLQSHNQNIAWKPRTKSFLIHENHIPTTNLDTLKPPIFMINSHSHSWDHFLALKFSLLHHYV